MSITKKIPLKDLPAHLPKKRGKKIAVSTIYRWTRAGVAGVRLETSWVGGMRVVDLSAVDEFFEAVARSRQPDRPTSSPTRPRDTKTSLADGGW